MAPQAWSWPNGRARTPVPVSTSSHLPLDYDLYDETWYRQLNKTTQNVIQMLGQTWCPEQHVRDICWLPVWAFYLPPEGEEYKKYVGHLMQLRALLRSA